MKILHILILLIPSLVFAQQDSILSAVYSWKEPTTDKKYKIASIVLFEGKVHDFEWMQMSAKAIALSKKKYKQKVRGNVESLLIIKSGMINIQIRDTTWALGAGSIALLMPKEKYSLQNAGNEPCTYYVMKYRSRLPRNVTRGKNAGRSFIKDWDKISFIPNDNGGGRRNYFETPTVMGKRIEMHVTTLKEGIRSHDPHTHRAEEIVLVIEGNTEMQIGDKFYKGKPGDIYYLGTNVLHAIRNVGTKTCMYFAFQFE